MFLTNKEKPDFRTILRFRKTQYRKLASLLQKTITIGLESQLITLEHVSIDGTKLRSFSSKRSFRDPKRMAQELKELERSFAENVREDSEEDDELEGSLLEELQDKEALRRKIRAVIKQYNEV